MNAIGKYESFLNSKTRLLIVAGVFLAYLVIGYIAAKPLAKMEKAGWGPGISLVASVIGGFIGIILLILFFQASSSCCSQDAPSGIFHARCFRAYNGRFARRQTLHIRANQYL